MADKQPPKKPDDSFASGTNAGWAVVSYLLAGIGIWGFVGWLVDRWLDLDGIATAVGCVLGAVVAVYAIVKKLGA